MRINVDLKITGESRRENKEVTGSFDIPEPVTYDVGIEKLGNMIGCIRGVSLQKGHQIARHLIEWKGIKFTEKGDK
tara:strand:- start:1187 stop:1414 length:228 start_codon:yes stop_codon:yes gene_type:complete